MLSDLIASDITDYGKNEDAMDEDSKEILNKDLEKQISNAIDSRLLQNLVCHCLTHSHSKLSSFFNLFSVLLAGAEMYFLNR